MHACARAGTHTHTPYLGSCARVSATVAEAVGWDTLDPSAPETLGRTSYRAAWGNLRTYGLE
eukprot:10626234-Alexandrium_andersonii.AAC.1